MNVQVLLPPCPIVIPVPVGTNPLRKAEGFARVANPMDEGLNWKTE